MSIPVNITGSGPTRVWTINLPDVERDMAAPSITEVEDGLMNHLHIQFRVV